MFEAYFHGPCPRGLTLRNLHVVGATVGLEVVAADHLVVSNVTVDLCVDAGADLLGAKRLDRCQAASLLKHDHFTPLWGTLCSSWTVWRLKLLPATFRVASAWACGHKCLTAKVE